MEKLDGDMDQHVDIDRQHDDDIVEFKASVANLVSDTKNKKIDEAAQMSKICADSLRELEDAKRETTFKISQLADLLDQAKGLNSKHPEVIAEVFKMEANLKSYQNQLEDIEKNIDTYQKKKDEHDVVVKQLKAGEDLSPN
jgi:peptidoglycan hydrolase CwlO-like protein